MVNDQLRIRIIEEARKQFQTSGIKRVTMSDISQQLGVSKKTLYNVFKDKKELIDFTLEHHINEDIAFVDAVWKEDKDGVYKLARIFFYFYTRMKSINPMTLLDLKKFYPEIWNKFECHKKGCFDQSMISIIEQGVDEELFLDDMNIPLLVSMRVWQLESAFDSNLYDHSKYSLATIQMEFFKHFIRGIATVEGVKLLNQYLSSFIKETQSTNI
ncbi:TetR/AcrR family transcriptional regulator [Flammeovirga sp. SubArs3]|uniref:TetR/AcrR family transcriptional regulator n=1 Tax=Flammeovirga sp. SubArs3 TaxID=2995316 RepID=UPI00248C9EFB|nr:TetR/AcrR family transcriptional regulator [Flammeovirga sp. SubArs3]